MAVLTATSANARRPPAVGRVIPTLQVPSIGMVGRGDGSQTGRNGWGSGDRAAHAARRARSQAGGCDPGIRKVNAFGCPAGNPIRSRPAAAHRRPRPSADRGGWSCASCYGCILVVSSRSVILRARWVVLAWTDLGVKGRGSRWLVVRPTVGRGGE